MLLTPIQTELGFLTIVPGSLYHWGDGMPHLGLEHASHLDIAAKRQALFGHCTIDNIITPEQRAAIILFDVYAWIDMAEPQPQRVFFPSFFVCQCQELLARFGRDWAWNDHKTLDVVCLMRLPKYGRLVASCWLANHAHEVSFSYTQLWDCDQHRAGLEELLQIGGLRDWTGAWGPETVMLPRTHHHDLEGTSLVLNFQKLYADVYAQAAACVVLTGTFWERGCELCDKYLAAVYSGCIPVVQGYRVYDRLRALGFDVFDDVIDTSSQYESNSVLAAWNLWDRNLAFFQRATEISRRPDIQRRLRRNLEHAQDLGSVYRNAMLGLNTPAQREILEVYKQQIWHHFRAIPVDFQELHRNIP